MHTKAVCDMVLDSLEPFDINRRQWLKRLLAPTLAYPLLAVFSQKESYGHPQQLPPQWREFPFARLATLITPIGEFFVRSHLNYPQLDLSGWRLKIAGLVSRALELSFEELATLSSTTKIVTFECSGNPPGGGMVSTAEWRGIALRQLLEKAGVSAKAKEVVFEGADFGLDEAESVPLTYARSIPVEKALAAETMIAWEMNGERLPREHGFPARVIVPGYYAMSHVKWLSRIFLVEHPFKGFYMVKRYFTARRIPGTEEFEIYPAMKMKVKAQIARPFSGQELSAGPSPITGGPSYASHGAT